MSLCGATPSALAAWVMLMDPIYRMIHTIYHRNLRYSSARVGRGWRSGHKHHAPTPCPRSALGKRMGLKILVSAVQSRPCPPLFSGTCPSRIFLRRDFVTRFVTNSGTLWTIPAHLRGSAAV